MAVIPVGSFTIPSWSLSIKRSHLCRTAIPRQLVWSVGQPSPRTMDDNAVPTLQHYVPGMYSVLADILFTTFMFGCLTVLSIVSVFHLIRRGIRMPSTAFMLGSVFILYAATATHFAIKTTYVVAHGRLLNAAVAALESEPPSSIDEALDRFGHSARIASYTISAVCAVNITIGDIIVWWRVYVLWRNRSIMALGLVFIVGTFVLGTLSTIHFQVNPEVQPLLSYADIYGGISALLSFISNLLATSLIGRKAWEHRQILRQGPGASKGRWKTPTMKVLTLLVGSGTIYSIFFSVAFIGNIMLQFKSSLSSSAREYLTLSTVLFTGCFVPMLAIYPTLIIFIVALNRSEIDGPLANATPSDIPTNMLPSLLFRGSSTAIHIFPSADHPPDAERAFDSTDSEDQAGEERSQPHEKAVEAGHLV